MTGGSGFRKGVLGGNRDHFEIMHSVLTTLSSEDGMGQTHVMFDACLSHFQLKTLRDEMSRCGLVRIEGKEKRWSITKKGRLWRELMEQALSLLVQPEPPSASDRYLTTAQAP